MTNKEKKLISGSLVKVKTPEIFQMTNFWSSNKRKKKKEQVEWISKPIIFSDLTKVLNKRDLNEKQQVTNDY